jgi:hypothetical protein
MSFQAPISVSDAIDRIRGHRLLLPAIQREFVWGPEKIEWLFDSLLQGYPIGSFLFWEVREQSVKRDYKFYQFLTTFRERYATHNPEFPTAGHLDFDAVLDGQQRLTALYLGLVGTYAYKKPRVWWEDNEKVLPTRKLYLNVLGRPDDRDDSGEVGRQFEFKFLTDDEYQKDTPKWFLIRRILDVAGAYEFNQLLNGEGFQTNEFSSRALAKLHSVIHTEKVINYYRIERSDIERALNVFVRVNSGGEPLSLSDMLMSTAIANWTKKDARKEILSLVDEIRGRGFFIDKDLVLKTCLYLYSSDIRYRVANFSAGQVQPFEQNWEGIRASIVATFDLVRAIGYNESALLSKNATLPITYWIHHKGYASKILTAVSLRQERDAIGKWLHIMLLKGVFGGSADTILAAIRKAFVGDQFGAPYVASKLGSFPTTEIASILRAQGKDPAVTDEFIDSLLFTQYDDRSSFTILALLAPNLDYKNGDFNKDHLHAASAFKKRKLEAVGVSESDMEFFQDPKNWNSILNLRHLDSAENKSKQDMDLAEWVKKEAKRQKCTVGKFCEDRDLPGASDLEFKKFRSFVGHRRKVLGAKLRQILT